VLPYKLAMPTSLNVVAIVDDDGGVRRALRRLVLSLSYRPTEFASGEDFLASLIEATPSCVLMDQHMPNLNGLDVLRRMRIEGRRVPVIIITGFDQPGLRRECFDAGASDYLVKPLEASAVSAALQLAMSA
jgi:FixJ family two-component response regulator